MGCNWNCAAKRRLDTVALAREWIKKVERESVCGVVVVIERVVVEEEDQESHNQQAASKSSRAKTMASPPLHARAGADKVTMTFRESQRVCS